jgi:hypothetical protein
MKNILRNTLAVIIGLLLGGCVNMALVIVGPYFIPPPAGVDVNDAQSIAASIHLFEPRHFIFPFLAHALGTLAGAVAAVLIAASHRSLISYAIGAAFLAGGIAAAFLIPAPTWFLVLDLGVAYLPMAWIGARLGQRKPGSTGP